MDSYDISAADLGITRDMQDCLSSSGSGNTSEACQVSKESWFRDFYSEEVNGDLTSERVVTQSMYGSPASDLKYHPDLVRQCIFGDEVGMTFAQLPVSEIPSVAKGSYLSVN